MESKYYKSVKSVNKLTDNLRSLFEEVLDDLEDTEGKYDALIYCAEQVVLTANKRKLDVKELLETIEELKEQIRMDKD